jgi:hypothetical protein
MVDENPFVGCGAGAPRRWAGPTDNPGDVTMLWLIVAIILFVIAIAGGAIVHPILFALAIVALIMAFMHFRRSAY